MKLGRQHSGIVKALILENQIRNVNGYDYVKGLQWIENTFLKEVPNHFIFGSFHENELVAITGLIMNFPFQNSSYICTIFYKPNFNKNHVKVLATEEAYRFSTEHGAPDIYSCILERRYSSFWNFMSRNSDFFKNFNVEPFFKIPAGKMPREPWAQFMLGYHAAPANCVVRKATFQDLSRIAAPRRGRSKEL